MFVCFKGLQQWYACYLTNVNAEWEMASRKGKLRGIHSKGTVDKAGVSRFLHVFNSTQKSQLNIGNQYPQFKQTVKCLKDVCYFIFLQ